MQTTDINEKIINVLIIEDYDLVKRGLKSYLDDVKGINVVGAVSSGFKMSDFFDKNEIDIAIVDLMLKEINGLEITKKIKEISPKTNIIIITNCNTPDEVILALGLGVKGYCSSNIAINSLVNVIKSVSKGACWIDSYFADIALKFFPTPKKIKMSDNIKSNVLPVFTARETEVLELIVEGKSNEEIAKELIVSTHTAKAHVCNILQKFQVTDRVQAAVKAVKYHIV